MWLPKGMKSKTTDVITDLQHRYDGRNFEPHLTAVCNEQDESGKYKLQDADVTTFVVWKQRSFEVLVLCNSFECNETLIFSYYLR